MLALFSDPVQARALLPLGQSDALERRWLQDTLAWLKDVPPELRSERLRHLAEGIRALSGSKERFQQIWLKAFASRVFAEAGLAEATSLASELFARIKGRLLPELEDDLDLYAALQMADLDELDAQWVEGLPDDDAAAWGELLGASAADLPVAIRLLALCEDHDVVPITHQGLAADVGTAREVVSRSLERMEHAGVLRLSRGQIEIVDRLGLVAIARSE